MTAYEVYKEGRDILRSSGVQSPDFDAMEIFKFCCNMSRQDLILNKNLKISQDARDEFLKCVNERKNGRPLQYILGMWSFMGLDFKVGEGVLIPRDDTEVLVEESASILEKKSCARILDLCAGSGAIAITLAKRFPSSEVVALELSDAAYAYLKYNIDMHKIKNIHCVQADVLCDYGSVSFGKFDLIVSNPPYIPSKDLKTLQREVLFEPCLALDGGVDGLTFYECILNNWTKFLNPGGYIAFEIGIGQSCVAELFAKRGFLDIRIIKDINGIDRVVSGKLK